MAELQLEVKSFKKLIVKLLEKLPQALGHLIKFVELELFICKIVILAQEQYLMLIAQTEKIHKGELCKTSNV